VAKKKTIGPACKACGVPFAEHLGLEGTCAALQKAKAAHENTRKLLRREKEISRQNPRRLEDARKLDVAVNALTRLRDCDWVIRLPDRMDAVRHIAKDALEEIYNLNPTGLGTTHENEGESHGQ